MRRGEVWLTRQPPPVGPRPVVLLSRDDAYRVRTGVTVAQITSKVYGIPVEVLLGPEDGLLRECVVNVDTITTIKKAWLVKRVCMLSPEKIKKINAAIRFVLALD